MSTWKKNATMLEARLQQALKQTPPRGAAAMARWMDARAGASGGGTHESAGSAGESAQTLERVLGRNDLVDVGFFNAMQRAAKAVCLVQLGDGGGTGWLLNERLLITNNHVLPTAASASAARAVFGMETPGAAGLEFTLDPDRCFVTSHEDALDYTVVAFAESDEALLKPFSTTVLSSTWIARAALGEPVNIVQHPEGQHKQYALRENEIIAVTPRFVHYRTDTNPGSSGSPVFNQKWQAVALHHAGVPRKVDGVVVNRRGQPWDESQGDRAIDWIANEGVRLDAILRDIAKQLKGDTERSALFGAMLKVPVVPEVHVSLRPEEDVKSVASSTPTAVTHAVSAGVAGSAPSAVFTIPLLVQVSVGAPIAGAAVSVSTQGGGAVDDGSSAGERGRALRRAESVTAENYYDAAADAEAREAYYADVDLDAAPEALFDALSALLQNTHTTELGYKEARLQHLYPVVDRVRAGDRIILRSLYTAEDYDDVGGFVNESFALTERFEARVAELRTRESSLGAERFALELDALERSAGYNCEHVVPQSWFGKRPPMVADLHHLFTCDARCNSIRGNHPLTDFESFPESGDNPCGLRRDDRFEPRNGKGAAARAILYFLVRYPGKISSSRYGSEDLETLRGWSDEEAPGEWEQHRNAEIEKAQGVRNPFIDHPALVHAVDFTRGLG